MAFTVLTDRPADWTDSELFPRPGPARRTIETGPSDGAVRSLRITSARVSDVTHGGTRVVADLGEASATLLVTGSRIAIAAATRRRPVVGHVRFEWVTSVLGRDRTPFVTPATVVVGFQDPQGGGDGSLLVTLAGRRASGTATARDLAAAVAAHRAMSAGGGARERLESLARYPAGRRSGSYIRFELADAS